MFGIVKKLLMARQIKFEESEITLFKQRIIMMPAYSYITLQKELEKRKVDKVVYKAMKELGIQWTNDLKVNYKMSPNDIVKWGINVLSLAGWGTSSIIKNDPKNKLVIMRLKNSSMAHTYKKKYGKSKIPVDHAFRGMAAGTFAAIFRSDIDAIETKCIASGSNTCEFLIKERSKFNLKDKEIAAQI